MSLQSWKEEFEGKNILIYGYGIEGRSTYRLIRRLCPDQIITIASMIEKEAANDSERAKIASVIYNRLNDSGSHGTYQMLNIDAALLYALPDHTGAITNEDKAVDSPYNLYKYAGLPPTPIANPGLAAIEAALEPESTDYYYYALGKDGRHHYSKTLNEHNAFVNSSEYGG